MVGGSVASVADKIAGVISPVTIRGAVVIETAALVPESGVGAVETIGSVTGRGALVVETGIADLEGVLLARCQNGIREEFQ